MNTTALKMTSIKTVWLVLALAALDLLNTGKLYEGIVAAVFSLSVMYAQEHSKHHNLCCKSKKHENNSLLSSRVS